ncbi:LysR family transcriptional regulator [Vibrio metschnikovii]|uniref:LysR family transcriptional regulator n=1 Tax=Vibrio metschnikovii TaxID=28172 RepID=UPI001302B3FF|nr:LysR family transcriptional regulator [Vibrio metschnikovii]EKO3791792.1 LysR family transcriptional regulator [Vibrio metschnikovii]
MFNIDQLRAFVKTVETGSFSSAARELGKAQSVISQHIINMELDCGVDLFDRSGRYPKLTAKGEELMPYAQATLIQLARMSSKASQLYTPDANQLILAMDEGIPLAKLPIALRQLEQAFPHLQIECLMASSRDIIELVESGRATTGLILSEPDLPTCLDFFSLGHIAFDVFVAKHHPLANIPITHIDELRQYRQLTVRSKNSQFSSLNQAFSPDIWYTDNYYTVLELAVNGFGWSFLPNHLAQSVPNALTRINGTFTNFAWEVNIDLIQHQKWNTDPLHQQARKALLSLFNDIIDKD